MKRGFAALLTFVMLLALGNTAEAVTPSAKEYKVTMEGTTDVFIGNETPVKMKEGKEVYLVYTVKSYDAKASTAYQHGFVASDNVSTKFMYEEGGLIRYDFVPFMLEVGSTYFLKFTVGDEGVECVAVRANGDDRQMLTFPMSYGEATDDFAYFGVWFGCGLVTAELTNVLCYDENGNDLGLFSTGAAIPPAKPLEYDTKIQQSYDLNCVDAHNVAILNKRTTEADIIYMEYTVESRDSGIYQSGAISTTKPNINYPHNEGILLYDMLAEGDGNGPLLDEGASYIVQFKPSDAAYNVLVQKTKDGTTEVFSFGMAHGTYNPEAGYVGLWFGEGNNFPVTFSLKNFKCYDENGNNLGIQSNKLGLNIQQRGERDDYLGCEAMYYSKETDTIYALYENNIAKKITAGVAEEFTYEIWENTIHFYGEGEKESYEYVYQRFYTDEVIYERMGTYYVNFVTGTDETPKRQTINTDSGYMAMRPENPTKEGADFEGWVLSDGTEYDFEQIVSESVTLYAKWSDGVSYESTTSVDGANATLTIVIAVSALLLIAGVCTSIVIIRRGGKKHEKNR